MRLHTEEDILKGLNPEQKEVVLSYGQPLLTIAGAGSGKTSTLTKKICHIHLIKGVPINNILAVTFTNKAAGEMQERVMNYLGLDKKPHWISTFHSLCIKILRGNMSKIDFQEDFTIYDGGESKSVVKNIVEPYVEENSLNVNIYSEDNIKSMISRIKLSVDFSEGLENLKRNFVSMDVRNKDVYFEHVQNMFNKYQDTLKQNNALDFDDLLVSSVKILKTCPETLLFWQNKFDYIMADEYQDTNGIQYELIKLIVGERNKNNIMVVGDAFQCIESESLVQTEFEGKKKIKDIEIGERVQTYKNYEIIYSEVTNKSKSVFYDFIKIKTNLGLELVTSLNHPFFISNTSLYCEYKNNQSDVKSVDEVSINSHKDIYSVYITSKNFKQSTDFKTFKEAYDYYKNNHYNSNNKTSLKEYVSFFSSIFSPFIHWFIKTEARNLKPSDIIPVVHKEKIFFDSIASIEYITTLHETDFYDIEIAETGLIIANDIVTHNCIYTWRGARAENILEFDKDFNNAKIVKLETNYRSSPNIIEFANKIVANSSVSWKDKLVKLKAVNPEGQDVNILQYSTDEQEAQTIVNQIQMLTRKGEYKFQDFTILMRMSFISRILEEYFIRYRIPYQIIGGLTFYERAEIKTLLSYLKFACNNNDKISLDRIINIPSRTIGKQALESIKNHYTGNWLEAIKKSSSMFRGTNAQINALNFINLFDEISPIANNKPYQALQKIINGINYFQYLQGKFPDNYEDRIGNVNELLNLLQRLEDRKGNFLEFLAEYVTKSDQDDVDSKTNRVKIMTIHSSKGLEFPVVFIPAMEEGILPSSRALTNEQLEEERRLFYVSVTRAKKLCLISSARQRGYASGGQKQQKKISRFLIQMDRK